MFKYIVVSIFSILVSGLCLAQPIVTDSTSNSFSKSETTVKSPPPTAIAPSFNTMNNDLCITGNSGSIQTQILGMSFGTTVRDFNCERLKLAKNLFDMGMKVAAVSTLCQDRRVFDAMMNAGTPCPIEGKIGEEAKEIWEKNPDKKPILVKEK